MDANANAGIRVASYITEATNCSLAHRLEYDPPA